jgi:hypothetical protein
MEAGIVDERTYDLLGRNFARKGVVVVFRIIL